jgi:NTE family protein
MAGVRTALCLPGGGASGAMFQIGALAALEDTLSGLSADNFDCYIGSSSGATVATALAAGCPVERIYRAFLDPGDDYFPLERRHILSVDIAEWRRTALAAVRAFGHGSRALFGRSLPEPAVLWEELARLYDSSPAGLFSLDNYERFLEDTFARRGVPNHFRWMPKALRIIAHELDTGLPAVFGAPGLDHVPISRACVASMATPPLFSPVRVGNSHYINPSPAQVSHIDLAIEGGAQVIVVINAMVPIRLNPAVNANGEVSSLRDRGAMWVANQANRIKLHAQLHAAIERAKGTTNIKLVVVEPDPTNGDLFLHNPASFGARRGILEYAYRTTIESVRKWIESNDLPLTEANWRPKTTTPAGFA